MGLVGELWLTDNQRATDERRQPECKSQWKVKQRPSLILRILECSCQAEDKGLAWPGQAQRCAGLPAHRIVLYQYEV